MGWYEQYQYSVGLEHIYRDDANNRTRVRLYANVYAGSAYYTQYGTDAYLHIDVYNGSLEGNTNWTPWSIARPTQTSLNGNNQWTRVWTSPDWWFYHDTNGYAKYRIYGNFESWGPWGTPTLWADTQETTSGLPDYDRGPYPPATPSFTRDRNSISLSTSSGGRKNGGPGEDYLHWYIGGSGDPGANTYWGQTGFSASRIDLNPTETYYFKAYSHNSDGWSDPSGVVTAHGAPQTPAIPTATRSTTVNKAIEVSWSAPASNLTIDQYAVDRYSANGQTYIGRIYSGGTATSVQDNASKTPTIDRGERYTYRVYAHNSSGWSDISSYQSTSIMVPGVPGKPSTVNTPTRIGRNVTVTAPKDATDYGNAVTEYRIQYASSDDDYATWYGWNGTSGVLNAYNSMNISGSDATFTYNMLTAAKTYKFRVYAVNSIGAGNQATDSAVLTTPFFLPASGKRWNGTSWDPTAVAKRWTGSSWGDISTAKRYTMVGAATSGNGTTGNITSSKGYYTRLNHTWSYNSSTDAVTISGDYILGATSTFFSGYPLQGSLTVNGQTVWTPSGNYSIAANSEITLASFNLTIPRASISYSSIPISSSVQMVNQSLAWSLPLIASSLTPQVINGTWVELT